MVAAAAAKIIQVPGHLIANPSDLSPSAGPTYGGTPLGNVSEVILRIQKSSFDIRHEEYGNEIGEHFEGSEIAVVSALMRGFDKDAFTTIFDRTSTSSKTGEAIIAYPGSTRAGGRGSDRSIVLLFAPDNTEEHPGILLYKAIPMLDAVSSMQFSRTKEFGVPGLFLGIRDTSFSPARTYQQSLMEDMSLT